MGLPTERQAQRFTLNVLIGFLPAALAGVLFIDFIKGTLFNPLVVALGFIVGGFVILWAEQLQKQRCPDAAWTMWTAWAGRCA